MKTAITVSFVILAVLQGTAAQLGDLSDLGKNIGNKVGKRAECLNKHSDRSSSAFLACVAGQSVEEFCTANPGKYKCPRVCCDALTAACQACKNSMTVKAFCANEENKDVTGCDKTDEERVDGAEKDAKTAYADCLKGGKSAAECIQDATKTFTDETGDDVKTGDIRDRLNKQTGKETADKVKECIKGGNGKTRKECTYGNSDVQKLVKQQLGKGDDEKVSDFDVEQFMNRGAEEKMKEARKECIKNAADADAKKACAKNNDVKEAVRDSLGKTDISGEEFEAFVRKGAGQDAANAVQQCIKDATNDEAKKACLGGAAIKDTLKESLGVADVTDTQVREFVRDGARDKLGGDMRTCVATAKGDADAIKACKSEQLSSLKDIYADSSITDIDVGDILRDDAIGKAADAVKLCSTEAGNDANKKKACSAGDGLKDVLKNTLGREVSDFEVGDFVRKGAKSTAGNFMRLCRSTATTDEAKGKCKTEGVKDELANALGKAATEIDDIEVEDFLRRSGMDKTAEFMKACVESAESPTAMANCASSDDLKSALGETLGKAKAEISERDVNEFLRRGAMEEGAKFMKSCFENAAGDKDALKACSASDDLKAKLGKTLGKAKDAINDFDVSQFIRDGASNTAKDAMSSCFSAESSKAQLKTCREGAKKTIAKSLGKPEEDMDFTTLQKELERGAKLAAVDAAKAAKAAGKGAPADITTAVKSSLEKALGRKDISTEEVDEFLDKGAQDALMSSFSSCMSGENAQLADCKTEAKKASAEAKAVAEADIAAPEFERKLRRGAQTATKEAIKSAVDLKAGGKTLSTDDVKQQIKDKLKGVIGDNDDAKVFDFVNDAVKEEGLETMRGCAQAKKDGDETGLSFDDCKKKAKEQLKSMLEGVRGADEVSDFDTSGALSQGATDGARSRVESCSSACAAGEAKEATQCYKDCFTKAQKVLADALGKAEGDVTKTETRKRLQEGAASAIADTLADVTKADANADAQTKKDAMKAALSGALGKAKDAIKDKDIEFFKAKGARRAVGKKTKACVQAARANHKGKAAKADRKAAIKACRAAGKEALKEILGAAEISDEKLQIFKSKNAKKEMAELRSACMDAAADKAERKKCVAEGRAMLKKALASVVGKEDEDVTDEDVEQTVVEGAAVVAADTAAACMEEVTASRGRRLDAHRACFATARPEIAKALGLESIDDEEAQEFLEKGAGRFIGDNIAACIDAIKTDDGRRLAAHAACFSKTQLKDYAEQALIGTGDMDGAGIRGQFRSAVNSAREAMEGAADADSEKGTGETKLSRTERRTFVDEAIERASGIVKDDTLSGGGRLARLKKEAGFDAIAEAGKACERTSAEECDLRRAWQRTTLGDNVDLDGEGADAKRARGKIKRCGSGKLLRDRIKACLKANKELKDCLGKNSVSDVFNKINDEKHMRNEKRRAIREVAGDLYEDCIREKAMTDGRRLAAHVGKCRGDLENILTKGRGDAMPKLGDFGDDKGTPTLREIEAARQFDKFDDAFDCATDAAGRRRLAAHGANCDRDAVLEATKLGFREDEAPAARISAAKRRASDAYGDCMSEFAAGSRGRMLAAHALKCEKEAKTEFENVSPGWEAEMENVKTVGAAKAEGRPIAFRERPEITSTVKFEDKCENVKESQVAADVHKSAGDVAEGSTKATKVVDGDACFVVAHTPVKEGKGDEAARNVIKDFKTTRRRLNSHNPKTEVSSSTTYEDDVEDEEGTSTGDVSAASGLNVLRCIWTLALTTFVVGMW